MEKSRILITGATGNVGQATLEYLQPYRSNIWLRLGNRAPLRVPASIQAYADETVAFDFALPETFEQALQGVDTLFLIRPPQLADVPRYFAPLVKAAEHAQVAHIVFLSVQGADKSRFIPHHKIEKLLKESPLDYTFLRPAYFYQNFLQNLFEDLVKNQRVFLPAGQASFSVVDVRDIGEVAANILINTAPHRGKAYDLTAEERLTFAQMTALLSKELGTSIRYQSPNLLRFYWVKRKAGMPHAFVLVMIMLHYLPRFQPPPPISDAINELTGHAPISFQEFAATYREKWLQAMGQ